MGKHWKKRDMYCQIALFCVKHMINNNLKYIFRERGCKKENHFHHSQRIPAISLFY